MALYSHLITIMIIDFSLQTIIQTDMYLNMINAHVVAMLVAVSTAWSFRRIFSFKTDEGIFSVTSITLAGPMRGGSEGYVAPGPCSAAEARGNIKKRVKTHYK